MSRPQNTPSNRVTLAFTCVGRRIELLQAFRAAAQRLNIDLTLIGIDSDPTAPGLACVDVPIVSAPVATPGYITTLLDLINEHQVNALVPTVDTDLLILAEHREQLAQAGCLPLISDLDTIHICRDKVRTYEHLRQHEIDTPETWTPEQIRTTNPRFPLFIKPRTGSASQWVHKLNDQQDLNYHLDKVRDPIVQEFVAGVEHTLDVYVGLTGMPQCVVPRARWAVRTGEVCKGVVVKDLEVMEAGRRVVSTLGNSVRGVVTLQCIVTPDRHIRFIEINPRLGGGAPLSIAAGADFPGWLLSELSGQPPTIRFDGFTHALCMLRYDWSVFAQLPDDLSHQVGPAQRSFPPFA